MKNRLELDRVSGDAWFRNVGTGPVFWVVMLRPDWEDAGSPRVIDVTVDVVT